MNREQILNAKRRLPMPELMAKLGFADHAKKSARCPFHEDGRASFSVFQGEDGQWRFKCFAGCGEGDEVDFLGLAKKLPVGQAIREFEVLAGINAKPSSPRPQAPPPAGMAFDWKKCLEAFTDAHQAKLAEWRGFSLEFVAWLHRRGLVGLFHDQHIAFPVHNADGEVIACHYRVCDPRTARVSWFYNPTGLGTHPLILGEPRSAEIVLAFESQWDCLAVADKLNWHTVMPTDTAAIITRGASNGKLIDGLCSPNATVYAFAQNDPPNPKNGIAAGEKWLEEVAAASGCRCFHAVTPAPHKDMNDFTKAGASAEALLYLMSNARLCSPPDSPIQTPMADLPIPLDDLPEESTKPFPVEQLPGVVAEMVAGTARCERVPVALPAICALGVLSAAIGAGIEVLSGPSRFTRGNLFLLASAESGSGKSETFRQLAKPLTDYQTSLLETCKNGTAPKLQAEIRVLEKEIAGHERKAAKSTDPNERDRLIGEMQHKIARRDEYARQAVMPCLIAQDVTTERLAVLLHQNREVLFSASADARKLVENLLGRYNPGKTTDESLYLSAYSGDFVRVDRQGRDPVVLHHPCLSLCWFVQPDMLATMLDEASLSASGFLPRLLLCHSHATPRKIEGESQAVSDSIRELWTVLIAGLIATYHNADKPFQIHPMPEAQRCLDDFHNQVVDRRTGDLADVGSFAARYAENAWRLSVLLHAAQYGQAAHNHPLDLETAQNAVALVEWFVSQQLDILARTRHQTAAKVEDEVFELLNQRADRQKVDFVTARDVHRARIVPTPAAAAALLDRMLASGLLTCEEIHPPRGGKSTKLYRAIGDRMVVPG